MNWNEIRKSKVFIKTIRPIINVLQLVIWYAIMIFIAWQAFEFQKQHPIGINGVKIALPNIISTIGIMNAILITFIFAKLYAEKSEIVARKKRMHQLSDKINALKKITYILFRKNQFWNNPKLIAEYQNYSKLKEEKNKPGDYSAELTEGLLLLRILDEFIDNIDDDYITYNKFNQIIYTQEDLENISSTLWLLLELMQSNSEEFLKVEDLSQHDQNIIIENINIINESESISIFNNNTLSQTIHDYIHIFLEEHSILRALNSRAARSYFNNLLFDLFVFVVLIIAGLILLNVTSKPATELLVNQLIVAVFIATVIDILKNIVLAVRFEFKAHGIKES